MGYSCRTADVAEKFAKALKQVIFYNKLTPVDPRRPNAGRPVFYSSEQPPAIICVTPRKGLIALIVGGVKKKNELVSATNQLQCYAPDGVK